MQLTMQVTETEARRTEFAVKKKNQSGHCSFQELKKNYVYYLQSSVTTLFPCSHQVFDEKTAKLLIVLSVPSPNKSLYYQIYTLDEIMLCLCLLKVSVMFDSERDVTFIGRP